MIYVFPIVIFLLPHFHDRRARFSVSFPTFFLKPVFLSHPPGNEACVRIGTVSLTDEFIEYESRVIGNLPSENRGSINRY